jgi:hypothetical protein
MTAIKVPPQVFGELYRHYRNGIPTGGFLKAVLSNDAHLSAAIADSTNRQHLADIILFNHWAKEYGRMGTRDPSAFDLKWESWRIRFSPQAEDLGIDLGDDND